MEMFQLERNTLTHRGSLYLHPEWICFCIHNTTFFFSFQCRHRHRHSQIIKEIVRGRIEKEEISFIKSNENNNEPCLDQHRTNYKGNQTTEQRLEEEITQRTSPEMTKQNHPVKLNLSCLLFSLIVGFVK